jgi:hypothetical protein
MVAIPGALLLHTPPLVALLNVLVAPEQALNVPVTGAGETFIVTDVVAIQPVGNW